MIEEDTWRVLFNCCWKHYLVFGIVFFWSLRSVESILAFLEKCERLGKMMGTES